MSSPLHVPPTWSSLLMRKIPRLCSHSKSIWQDWSKYSLKQFVLQLSLNPAGIKLASVCVSACTRVSVWNLNKALAFLLIVFKQHFQKGKKKNKAEFSLLFSPWKSAQEFRKAKKNILHSSSHVPVIRRPENDQNEEANYRQKGNKQNNKWGSVRERETSLATQPWEFNISSVCHLHAKFPCLPSTEFPLALSALISIG